MEIVYILLQINLLIRKILAKSCCFFVFDKKLKRAVENYFLYFNFKYLHHFSTIKYKILPIGSFCFPRVVCTLANIKPRKIYGEKTCPFDLAFYLDLESVCMLLENNFENFFDDVEFDHSRGCWVNKKLNIIFNHDTNPLKSNFICKYKNRIDNFYNYVDNSPCLFFVYSTWYEGEFLNDDFKKLYLTLQKITKNKPFGLVILNHSLSKVDNLPENATILDVSDFNLDDWLNKIKSKDGLLFASKLGDKMSKFIQKVLLSNAEVFKNIV